MAFDKIWRANRRASIIWMMKRQKGFKIHAKDILGDLVQHHIDSPLVVCNRRDCLHSCVGWKTKYVFYPTHECNQSFLLHTTNGESMWRRRSLRISFACVLNPFCRFNIQMLDALQFSQHILSKAIPCTRCYDSAPSQDVDDSCVGCHYRNFLACSFILSLLTSA